MEITPPIPGPPIAPKMLTTFAMTADARLSARILELRKKIGAVAHYIVQ